MYSFTFTYLHMYVCENARVNTNRVNQRKLINPNSLNGSRLLLRQMENYLVQPRAQREDIVNHFLVVVGGWWRWCCWQRQLTICN